MKIKVYKSTLCYWLKRILAVAFIFLFYHAVKVCFSDIDPLMIPIGAYELMILSVSLGFGLLLGWFLCDDLTILWRKRTLAICALLLFFSLGRILYWLPGYIGWGIEWRGMWGILLIMYYCAKYFQVTFGAVLFLVISQAIRSRRERNDAAETERFPDVVAEEIVD